MVFFKSPNSWLARLLAEAPESVVERPITSMGWPGRVRIRRLPTRPRRPAVAAAALAVLLMSAHPLPGSPAPAASRPPVPDPAAGLDRTVAAAEASLRTGDAAGAERHYRAA